MNDLEADLRRVLANAPGQPDWPVADAVERVHIGMAGRRTRRRVLAAAGTIVAAVVLVQVPGIVSGVRESRAPVTSNGGTDVVPWIDEAVIPGPARVPATACRGADLANRQVETSGSRHVEDVVIVKNAGSARCTLSGSPVLTGENATGARVTVPLQPSDEAELPAVQERPATIDPGEEARVVVETSDACVPSPEVTYRNVRIEYDGATFGFATRLSSRCGFRLGTWYRDLVTPPNAGPLPSTLRIELQDVPATVPMGGTFDYVVELRNPGSTDVQLTCPDYVESIGKTERHYLLNCRMAPAAIPAGGSVRFAMRMTLGAEVDHGAATLFWAIRGTAFASATINVVP